MPKCPVCGEELIEVGYPKDFFQEYKCPNGCDFEPPLSWKIQDALGIAICFLFAIALIILAVLTYVPRSVFEYIRRV